MVGSYSRSFLIGSAVGLIGIGICIALEQTWRNRRRASSGSHVAQSSWVQDETTTSETEADNIKPISEHLHINDDSPKQEDGAYELINSFSAKRTEDEITYLHGGLSNMTMGDKSSPGLPGISINLVNFRKQDDNLALSGDTAEIFESYDSLSTELDVDIEDDSKESFWSNKRLEHGHIDVSKHNFIENLQTNKKIVGGIEEPVHFPSTQLDGAPKSNPEVVYLEQRIVSGSDTNVVSGLSDPYIPGNENVHLSDCNYARLDMKLDSSGINQVNLISDVGIEDLKQPESSKEGVEQGHVPSSSTKHHTSDVIPESRNRNVQDINELPDNKNDTVLSRFKGIEQFSQLEETLLLQFIKDLLEEAFGSISSSIKPLNYSEHQIQDSTLGTFNKENVNLVTKVSNTRPVTNKLPYSVIAAIPKKTVVHDKGISRRLRKEIETPFHTDNDEVQELSKPIARSSVRKLDEVQELPKPSARSSVRKLVGFFEKRCDQN